MLAELEASNMASGGKGNIAALLARCSSHDQDERYMAFSDLCQAMGEGSHGEETEKKVVERVLLGLDDASNDVQSMAVKLLSVLYANLESVRVVEIGQKVR